MTILLIAAAVLALVSLLPIGAEVELGAGKAQVRAIAGPLRIRLYPPRSAGKKKPAPEKHADAGEKKSALPPLTLDVLRGYVSLAVRVCGRVRRHMTVRRLKLHCTFAGSDPFNTALSYGAAHAALANILAVLCGTFDVRETDVRLDADFDGGSTAAAAGAQLELRLWAAAYIAVSALAGFLKIVMAQKKAEKIKTAERTDGYGKDSHRRDDGEHDVQDQGDGGRQYGGRHADNNA